MDAKHAKLITRICRDVYVIGEDMRAALFEKINSRAFCCSRKFDYQSKRRCSKTRISSFVSISQFDYQSKRRCSKT